MIDYDKDITINALELERLIEKGIKKYYINKDKESKEIKYYIMDEIDLYFIYKQINK